MPGVVHALEKGKTELGFAIYMRWSQGASGYLLLSKLHTQTSTQLTFQFLPAFLKCHPGNGNN